MTLAPRSDIERWSATAWPNRQGESALTQFGKAIALAHDNKDLGAPIMALTGKATTLVTLKREGEAVRRPRG